MAITAVVILAVTKVSALPAAAPGAGNTRYVRASIEVGGDKVFTGRSSPVPDAGGDVTLAALGGFFGGSDWGVSRGVDDSASFNITIEIWEDHGDFAPPAPATISGTISGPWSAYSAISYKTLGGGPTTFQVMLLVRSFNITDLASLARSIWEKGTSATLTITKGFLLELVSIDGLYQPDPAAVAPALGSKAVAGYFSRDNLGRIFTNRLPDGKWKSDTQCIDVRIKITAFGGAKFPGGAKVHWNLDNPDDLTNDDPGFHRAWGPYVDQNDYDAAGNPTGMQPGGNALAFSPGNGDDDKLFGASAKGANRWAAGPGGEAAAGASRFDATSPLTIVDAKSATCSVRVHCPNVLGTSLRLWAVLDGVPADQNYSDAITGVMTMWSRLDVEVARMTSAFSLANALANIPQRFLAMCVQMDLQLERIVADKDPMSPDDPGEETATAAWIADPLVFKNRGIPGWFFVGGALFASPLAPPGKLQKPVYQGTSYKLGTGQFKTSGFFFGTLTVPGNAAAGGFVRIDWKDGADNRRASFGVISAKFSKGKTTILLMGNDIIPAFTGWDSDGSIAHAYLSTLLFFPQHQRASSATALAPGGFGIPASGATVTIFRPGVASATAGISPLLLDAAGTEYFGGQTVVFTSAFGSGTPLAPTADFDTHVASTIVHEFVHAFGMPHKCGYWNWKTPRLPDGKTCCMNYFSTWLIDPASIAGTPKLVPGFDNRMDDNVCGRHLMEVRRVHLELNRALRWV